MCLGTITKTIEKPTDEEVVAWKVFKRYNYEPDRLWSPFYGDSGPVQRGIWLKAESVDGSAEIVVGLNSAYPLGFHGMKSREGLRGFIKNEWSDLEMTQHQNRRYRLVRMKVKLRKVHTIGKQAVALRTSGYGQCYVAQEMYVPLEGEEL